MAPLCPTCEREYGFFFGPAYSSGIPLNENFWYPTCGCNNWIAVQSCHASQYGFFNTDCFHLIFLENYFINYFDVIRPLRTFNKDRPSVEVHMRFKTFKEKYAINKNIPTVSDYTLYNLLVALENQYKFNKSDIDWLNERGLHPITANYHIQEYNRTFNPWLLVKSCSSWRKAGYPQIGLQVTQNASSNRNDVMAAILTTRGAAFKDLRDLTTAEQCAQAALTYEITKFPYSLLGAIYYLYGLPHKGDEYFQKAIELGLSSKEQDKQIFKAYNEAGMREKEEIKKYLASFNPTRYLSIMHRN
jgi:hypothetical protein